MLSSFGISERWCIKFYNLIKVRRLKIGISENFQTSKTCGNSNVFHTLLRIAIYACNCTKHLQILFCFSRIRPFEKKKIKKRAFLYQQNNLPRLKITREKHDNSRLLQRSNLKIQYVADQFCIKISFSSNNCKSNTKIDLIYFFHATFVPFVIFPRKRGN